MTGNDSLNDKLSRYREITISVTGRKSGKTISVPIWFVFDDDTLYLLPVYGSDTQWYKNVLQNPSMKIEARGTAEDFKAVPITSKQQVAEVVEKFRGKYGAADVKKYYSKFDVAVVAARNTSLGNTGMVGEPAFDPPAAPAGQKSRQERL